MTRSKELAELGAEAARAGATAFREALAELIQKDTAEESTPALEDIASDARQLYHLIDTLCDQQFGATDAQQRERCDALLWIVRDCCARLRVGINRCAGDAA